MRRKKRRNERSNDAGVERKMDRDKEGAKKQAKDVGRERQKKEGVDICRAREGLVKAFKASNVGRSTQMDLAS